MAAFNCDEAFLARVNEYLDEEGVLYVSGLRQKGRTLSVSDAFDEISRKTDLGREAYGVFCLRYPELIAV